MLKNAILAVAFMAMLTGALVADKSTFDPAICPVGPMKFSGVVTVVCRPDSQNLFMSAYVWKGGVAASGGVMTLMGNRIRTERNWYTGSTFGTRVRSGDMVTAIFQAPWAGVPPYAISLAAPLMIHFTSPANDSHVALAGGGALTVNWRGGTPPYRLTIHRLSDHARVFFQTDIAVGGVSVPFRTFSAGQRYQITVDDAHRKFAYDHAVDAASDLSLGLSSGVFFYAD